MRFLFTLLVILFYSTSWAQPNRLPAGCHHTHQRVRPQRLTDEQRVLLNQSIARSDTFDIASYRIDIDVTDYAGHSIKAATTIAFSALLENQQVVHFDLFQLQVDSVLNASQQHLSFSHDGEILSVHFSEPLAVGVPQLIRVFYHGDPYRDPTWGGFYFESGYIYNLGIGLTTIPPNFGKVWYPCFDSFVERATYEYHVKSAGTYRAHCQGTFLGETALQGDTVIRSFAFTQPITTHQSAIAVADYEDNDYVYDGAFGSTDVRLTAKPAQLGTFTGVMQHLGSAIDACEYWYGPHAWERVGYVLTTDGALEIPTNIAYPQSMITASLSANDKLLAHELGHQWWGNVIAPFNHNDMWLKEGPAEYSAHLMTEWMYGQPDFIHQVKTNHLDVLKNAHIDDGGFQPMSPMPDEVIYGTHTYYKGASVMHNLRAYMGDALFRSAMSSLQSEHTYTSMTPEQFRDWLEEASGLSLDHFFDDQIFQPGFSVFVVDSFQVDNELPGMNLITAFVQQKTRACDHLYDQVPVDYTCVGGFGQLYEGHAVFSGQYDTLQFTCPFEPRMLILNRHGRLNQARMDFEVVLDSTESLNPILPYVDFRVYKENVVDSTLLRIEHVWAAPDQGPLGDGIFEISPTHYYVVDGLWNPGDFFTGKVYYNGSASTDLDYELYNGGEEQAVLLYRRDASQPWELCDDFSLGGGSLTNGDGSFVIDTLRLGQYAFANGDISAPVDEVLQTATIDLKLYPNPATQILFVEGELTGSAMGVFEIYATNGRLLSKSMNQLHGHFQQSLDVSGLSAGEYILRAYTVDGFPLGIQPFLVRP
jgi:hypothetical protein